MVSIDWAIKYRVGVGWEGHRVLNAGVGGGPVRAMCMFLVKGHQVPCLGVEWEGGPLCVLCVHQMCLGLGGRVIKCCI